MYTYIPVCDRMKCIKVEEERKGGKERGLDGEEAVCVSERMKGNV